MKQVRPEAIEAFTRRMFTRVISAMARTLRDEELSVAQVAALYLVDENGPMRIGEVAAALGRSLPAASRLTDDLVRRGLLQRDEDPEDRRARLLTTSAKGRTFLTRAGDDRVKTILEAVDAIPAELFERLAALASWAKR
jgi:DNA-binding MarR family transcriptional regulator